MADGMNTAPWGRRSVTPHLVVKGAEKALAFYAEALGAHELFRMAAPDGLIMHASMTIGDGGFYLCDEFPGPCAISPATLGGTPVTIHLDVEDVDASFARAVAAGAEPTMPPADMFWGDRYAQVVDPFGHRWSMATPIANASSEEMARHAATSQAEPQPA